MKKTLKLLVILVAALILLSGCAKIDYNVDIKEDGKAEVSYVVAIENQYLEQDDTSDTDTSNLYLESLKSEAERAENNGYTAKEFKDDKYTGYKITKSFDNVEDISLQDAFGESVIKNDSDSKIKFEKNGSNVKISQDATFDVSQYIQGYEIIYTVNLPVKVKENNATKVDGNKLTWVLVEGQTGSKYGSETEEEIKKVSFTAEGGALSINNIGESLAEVSTAVSAVIIIAIVVGLILVLGIIVVIIICVTKSKKKTKTEPTNTVEQVNDDKKTDENK